MKFEELPIHIWMEITARPSVVFVHGKGSWLRDHEGRRYLDFAQRWAVNGLGRGPSVVVHALAEQARKFITLSPRSTTCLPR